jgi:signal transduction histidine kinase
MKRRFRLFWLMVIAFAMAILLALCSMLGFVGLTFLGNIPSDAFPAGLSEASDRYNTTLSEYYLQNNNSWAGVAGRLNAAPFSGEGVQYSASIFGTDGALIASTDRDVRAVIESDLVHSQGMPHGPTTTRRFSSFGRPAIQSDLSANGVRIGLLLVQPRFELMENRGDGFNRRPPTVLWNIWRGFAFAGLAFGVLLLGLAILFSRRVTRPLRTLSTASEALAAGKLATRVPRVRIRELDDVAQAFNRMAERLANADSQRRQMTADIAHELRTPLSIIRGRLEGIQDGVYQATPEQVDGLLHETAMLERLVEDLRVLALAEAGQLPLYREPTDPMRLLRAVATSFEDQALQQGVTIELLAEPMPEVALDPQRMNQVFANLLSNALRYTPAGGNVTLRARLLQNQQSVLFSVEDTGPGIANEDIPHLFDRFWRADRSRTRESGGSGLGLAIVKQIVLLHGGTVQVRSALGQGTTFEVLLPNG